MATLTGLAPVLVVPEVQETLAYYRDKLGFRVEEWEPNPRGADLLQEPIERPWQMLEIRVQDPFGYILAFGQRL